MEKFCLSQPYPQKVDNLWITCGLIQDNYQIFSVYAPLKDVNNLNNLYTDYFFPHFSAILMKTSGAFFHFKHTGG